MKDLHKDILIGAMFIAGLLGFISGEFIISSVIFAVAAIMSNVHFNHNRRHNNQLPC